MRQAGEPAVEDILESIKKVIVRDAQVAAAEEKRPIPVASIEPEDHDAQEEVLELATEIGTAEEAPLMKSATVGSMRDSLAALETMAAPGVPPQIVRSGETSLEGLVREMLRPLLADWLEKNLPPLVESMVSAEIARIVGKKG